MQYLNERINFNQLLLNIWIIVGVTHSRFSDIILRDTI